jgi:hypothetical protein
MNSAPVSARVPLRDDRGTAAPFGSPSRAPCYRLAESNVAMRNDLIGLTRLAAAPCTDRSDLSVARVPWDP